MFDRWETKRALIVVKTYPTPAWKGGEVVCTAAITEAGEWLRLFPIPYRLLDSDKKFEKYQWIEARVTKATSDARPESYKVDVDSIRILKPPLTTRDHWQARKTILYPLRAQSMCWLRAKNKRDGGPTLGLIRPKSIDRLRFQPVSKDWSTQEMARLTQQGLLDSSRAQLEKIPFTFYYDFHCEASDCPGHRMSCTDWEMTQSYRSWLKKYGQDWQAAFRQRYEREMQERFDTHFYVGTVHGHPFNWVIVGLFWPTKADEAEGTQAALL